MRTIKGKSSERRFSIDHARTLINNEKYYAQLRRNEDNLVSYKINCTWQARLILALIATNYGVEIYNYVNAKQDIHRQPYVNKERGNFRKHLPQNVTQEEKEFIENSNLDQADQNIIDNFIDYAVSTVQSVASAIDHATTFPAAMAEEVAQEVVLRPITKLPPDQRRLAEVFEKNKHKIKIYNANDDEKALQDFYKEILEKLAKKGEEESIKFMLENIDEILLFDPKRLSLLSKLFSFINYDDSLKYFEYNPLENRITFKFNFDNPQYQQLPTFLHELRHFEQFHLSRIPDAENLLQCVSIIENMRDDILKCLTSMNPDHDCRAVRPLLEHYDHLTATDSACDSTEFFFQRFAQRNNIKLETVIDRGVKIFRIHSFIDKNGNEIKATDEQKILSDMLLTIVKNLISTNADIQELANFRQDIEKNGIDNVFGKDPSEENVKKYFGSYFAINNVKVTKEEMTLKYHRALIEVEAMTAAIVPKSLEEVVCKRSYPLNEKFLEYLEKTEFAKYIGKYAKEHQKPQGEVARASADELKERHQSSIDL